MLERPILAKALAIALGYCGCCAVDSGLYPGSFKSYLLKKIGLSETFNDEVKVGGLASTRLFLTVWLKEAWKFLGFGLFSTASLNGLNCYFDEGFCWSGWMIFINAFSKAYLLLYKGSSTYLSTILSSFLWSSSRCSETVWFDPAPRTCEKPWIKSLALFKSNMGSKLRSFPSLDSLLSSFPG